MEPSRLDEMRRRGSISAKGTAEVYIAEYPGGSATVSVGDFADEQELLAAARALARQALSLPRRSGRVLERDQPGD